MKFFDKLKNRVETKNEVIRSSTEPPAESSNIDNTSALKRGLTDLREKIIGIKESVISTDELFDKRINICKSCENFNSTTATCKLCGCFMNLKTRLAGSNCPINKW